MITLMFSLNSNIENDDISSKVDKLVRVRRLLSRLEFLSELPEKLSEMILTEVSGRILDRKRE